MNTPVKLAISTVFACGFAALASGPASAMPLARTGVDVAPITEEAHAARVCNRWGRCWWSAGGHVHGPRYGWRRGYHYGWRHPYRGGYRYRHW